MGLNIYRNEVLEAIARKIISQYDPCLLSKPAPIPVESIMEKTYGLSLEFYYIRKDERILGETVFEDAVIPIYDNGYKLVPVKAGTVIIDERIASDKRDGRFRFTCAHELAHWVLHKELYTRLNETAYMSLVVTKSSEVNKNIERQADRLGSYILMPKGAVKIAFNRNRNNICIVDYLAELFIVSRQAMQIRLAEIGLLS